MPRWEEVPPHRPDKVGEREFALHGGGRYDVAVSVIPKVGCIVVVSDLVSPWTDEEAIYYAKGQAEKMIAAVRREERK